MSVGYLPFAVKLLCTKCWPPLIVVLGMVGGCQISRSFPGLKLFCILCSPVQILALYPRLVSTLGFSNTGMETGYVMPTLTNYSLPYPWLGTAPSPVALVFEF